MTLATGIRPVLCVVGARPNFMKIAPILKAMRLAQPPLPFRLLHTGQHYGEDMNRQFFEALGIPHPDVNLEVGSASHAAQTAEIMRRFEPVLDSEPPSAVLVVGDVNSTLACALVAAKKSIPVIHVEAGLRSYDRQMPEEINRVLTDQLSDLLFTTERDALGNLTREGIDPARVRFVGNVMIDTLRASLEQSVPAEDSFRDARVPQEWLSGGFALVTLHRPSNVDEAPALESMLGVIREASRRIPVVFPMHPRTRMKVDAFGLGPLLTGERIACLPPLGYLQMLGLMRRAKVVLTDSGGIQEETTALGVPCITLRESTERPITVTEGTNVLAGTDPARILHALDQVLAGAGKAGRIPALWDGHAADRIVDGLQRWLAVGGEPRSVAAERAAVAR